MEKKQKNVLGEELEKCSLDPLTGWYRDGCCNTDEKDHGLHTVCAKVNNEFLEWCKEAGNDLITPHPEFGFSGLPQITKFKLINSWAVRQFKGDYNPTHWHNGHISGVGYLKVPKDLGNKSQEGKKNNPNGQLELIHGTKQFLSQSTFMIKPKVGEFYFFPNYMMHTVYPFKETDEERRSVSFNAYVDDHIYNVYAEKV